MHISTAQISEKIYSNLKGDVLLMYTGDFGAKKTNQIITLIVRY